MIDGYRRGWQSASNELLRRTEMLDVPKAEHEGIARRVLAALQQAGYAHLEPESEFVRGFVERLRIL